MTLYIDSRIETNHLVTKKHISIEWFTFQPFIEHWMDKWFMVFDEIPYNKKEVPLYFLRKLWVEIILGHHVNYFDISEFHVVCHGSSQEW